MALSVASSGRRSFVSIHSDVLARNASSRRTQIPIPDDLKKIILDFRNKESIKAYENLVCSLRDFPIEDAELSKLLWNARENISLLSKSVLPLVNAILKIKWTHRSESTINDYQGFLVDLLCAHNYYTKVVFEELIRTFTMADQEFENAHVELQSVVNYHVHEVLKVLLQIIPMSLNLLKETVEANFPYLRKSSKEHVAYIINTLQITEYLPELRIDFLFLITDRLIILDVNAPKHEIMAAEDNSNDEIFETELDNTGPNMKHTIAETLDTSLAVLLSYINTTCYDMSVSSPELKLENTRKLFQEMLNIFDCLILPTHATHHVQFIMFHMSNMKMVLADMFLTFLWQKVTSPRIANVIRQTAVSYIGSFLVRSKVVTIRLLMNRLSEMINWIHNYIAKQEDVDCSFGDMKVHPVFYSVCQAIFYIISIKYCEFVKSKKGLLFLQGLNLTKVVTCNLNPLKFCLPDIIHSFAAVTRNYQLVYCYTIIEHNSRMRLPVVHLNDQGLTQGAVSQEIIDTFFPFDPCILKKSGQYIHPMYLDVKSSLLSESMSSEGMKQEDDDEDFLIGYTSVSPTIPILGISPSF